MFVAELGSPSISTSLGKPRSFIFGVGLESLMLSRAELAPDKPENYFSGLFLIVELWLLSFPAASSTESPRENIPDISNFGSSTSAMLSMSISLINEFKRSFPVD